MKSLKNKGFTLIEMVVAFAVLGVAVFGIGGFFVSAARSYSSVSDETSLQYEAQLALNQVESMLIDSTLGVSYNFVKTGATATNGGYQFVEKDSEASGAAVSKVLYAYNVGASAGLLDIMMLKWDDNEKAIYYKVQQVSNPGPSINTIDVSSTLSGWDLLAEDVEAFSVDLSEYTKTKKVEIKLGFKNRSKDYETSGTVVLRNNVLINETDIGKIYNRISWAPPSTITGIGLTSNMDVTVPGGAVQLYTNVLGDGYPETKIEQYQWIVAKDSAFTNIIYDSLINYDETNPRPATYVDTSNKVLRVSADTTGEGSDFNETLWVKVVVITSDKDEDDNPIKLSSTALSIGVKLINNIVVSVAADTSQSYNSNLVNTKFEKASWAEQKEQSSETELPTMTLMPGNIVQLTGTVTSSDSIAAEDKAILWSIHNVDEGVDAEISSTGLLKIRQYSKNGGLIVRATLKMDSGVYVEYDVQVEDEYSVGNAELKVVVDKSTLNRGGSVDCSLLLNGMDVDNSDYDWSVSTVFAGGQELTGNAVTVNDQGKVSANYELSYDYSYDVYVKAQLKTNSGIKSKPVRISVPKVSLQITPLIKTSSMGTTVSGITCTAVGLKEYDIHWEMAKDSNPKYFFTAWGNFNITGSKNSDGTANATVVMGSAKDPQTNCTVKATLKDNPNYQATMKLVSGNISMGIRGPISVSRPLENGAVSTCSLTIYVDNETGANLNITNETVKWEVVDAAVDNTSVKEVVDKNTISIAKGELKLTKDFASSYEYANVVLTIKARSEAYGLEATHTVTVTPVNFTISPDMVLIPDGSNALTIKFAPAITGWSMSGNKSGDGISINSNTGVLTLPANTNNQNDNKTLTIGLSQYNKYTEVQFGFEFFDKVDSWYYKEVSPGRFGNTYRKYSIYKSQYRAYNATGILCPVYHVGYQEKNSSNGKYGNITFYVFISNTNESLTNGTWYKATGNTKNNRVWSTSSAPTNWDYKYFPNN